MQMNADAQTDLSSLYAHERGAQADLNFCCVYMNADAQADLSLCFTHKTVNAQADLSLYLSENKR